MSDFFNLYNKILDSIDTEAYVENLYAGPRWSIAKCEGNLGLAMSTVGSTIAPMFHKRADSMQLSEFSKGIKSWNFPLCYGWEIYIKEKLSVERCFSEYQKNTIRFSLWNLEPLLFYLKHFVF